MEFTAKYSQKAGWYIAIRVGENTRNLSNMEVIEACEVLNEFQRKEKRCRDCGSKFVKHSGGYITPNNRDVKTFICLNCGSEFSIDD